MLEDGEIKPNNNDKNVDDRNNASAGTQPEKSSDYDPFPMDNNGENIGGPFLSPAQTINSGGLLNMLVSSGYFCPFPSNNFMGPLETPTYMVGRSSLKRKRVDPISDTFLSHQRFPFPDLVQMDNEIGALSNPLSSHYPSQRVGRNDH